MRHARWVVRANIWRRSSMWAWLMIAVIPLPTATTSGMVVCGTAPKGMQHYPYLSELKEVLRQMDLVSPSQAMTAGQLLAHAMRYQRNNFWCHRGLAFTVAFCV